MGSEMCIRDRGNVLGMMPHPERGVEKIFGSEDGRMIFESVASWIESRRRESSGAAGRKPSASSQK